MDTQKSFVNREKRFEVNAAVGFEAIVSRTGSDDSMFYAELTDFSRTGMKLNLPFCARFDEILKLRFEFKESDLRYDGVCRVRHMRNVSESKWQVGCSIEPSIPDEIIEFLAIKTNQERRKFSRIDVAGKGKLRRQDADDIDACVQNMSRGGFCLAVSEVHEIGDRIDFLTLNPRGEVESVAGRVRWQDETEDGYEIGCGFAESASYEKLIECFGIELESRQKESLGWHVLAAAVAALILPTVSYFVLGTNHQNSQASNQPAVGIQSDAPELKPPVAGPTKLADSKNLNNESDASLSMAKQSKLPSTIKAASSIANVKKPAAKTNPESKPSSLPATSDSIVDRAPKALPTGTPENKLVGSRPALEESIPIDIGSLRKSTRRVSKQPRPAQLTPTTEARIPVDSAVSSKVPKKAEQKRESPITELPKELVEFIDRHPKVKRFEKGSSRRVQPIRSLTIPSEEIRPSI